MRFHVLCAIATVSVGLAACAGTSEPARTAAANRGSDATTADALARRLAMERNLEAVPLLVELRHIPLLTTFAGAYAGAVLKGKLAS